MYACTRIYLYYIKRILIVTLKFSFSYICIDKANIIISKNSNKFRCNIDNLQLVSQEI